MRRAKTWASCGRRCVNDPGPFAATPQQTRPGQGPHVMRGVGHALTDLARDLLHRAFALGEQIDDLSPPATRQRLGHTRQRLVQRILRAPVAHPPTIYGYIRRLSNIRLNITGLSLASGWFGERVVRADAGELPLAAAAAVTTSRLGPWFRQPSILDPPAQRRRSAIARQAR